MNYRAIIEKISSKMYELFLKFYYKDKICIKGKVLMRKGRFINISENGLLVIGDNCFFNNYCSINCKNKIIIGDDCLFGEGVKIYDHNHKFYDTSLKIREQGYSCDEIKIGNNCWIGSNVTILKGVKIGNNVVIGANCLVYKSVPDNSIIKNDTQIHIEQLHT